MSKLIETINNLGIIPVTVLNSSEDVEPVGEALLKGNLPCAEITFRTECAAKSIETLVKKFPQMIVGAGTVLSIEQVDAAVASGAQFIVSPGFNPKVVSYCLKNNYLIFPGVMTPSEMESAMEMGLSILKLFPIQAIGGINYLKAVSSPYPMLKFIPTGGINAENLKDYAANKSVLACGGSWMVSNKLIQDRQFEKIAELSAEAVKIIQKSKNV